MYYQSCIFSFRLCCIIGTGVKQKAAGEVMRDGAMASKVCKIESTAVASVQLRRSQ